MTFARVGFLVSSAMVIAGCCRQPATVTADLRPTTYPALAVTDGRIRPGDLLRVTIGDLVGVSVDTLTYVRVSNAGSIRMAFLPGPIKVGGLTAEEAETAIAKALADAQLLRRAFVIVEIVPTNIEANTP